MTNHSYQLTPTAPTQAGAATEFRSDPFYHRALQHIQGEHWQQAAILLASLVKVYPFAIELRWLHEDVRNRSMTPTVEPLDAAPLAKTSAWSRLRKTGQDSAGSAAQAARGNMAFNPTASAPAQGGPRTVGNVTALAVRTAANAPLAQPKAPKTTYLARQSRLWKVIVRHVGAVKWSMVAAGAAILGETITDILSPWPLKIIIDTVLQAEPMTGSMARLNTLLGNNLDSLLLVLALAIAGLAGLNSLFAYCQTYLTSRIGFQLVSTLRRELFAQIQRLPLSFHQTNKRGELLDKISTDTQMLREAFSETGLVLVTSWLSLLGMLSIMVVVNWQLSLIPLITVPMMLFIITYKRRQLRETIQQQRHNESKIVSQMAENLSNMSVVKAFGRERHETERFQQANETNLAEGIKTMRLGSAMSRAVSLISALGLSAVVFYGAWLAVRGRITPGDVVLFVSYIKSVYKPIREIAKLSAKMTRAMVSARRINEILETESEEPDSPNARLVDHLDGQIDFQHVTFAYKNDGRLMVDNLSFAIRPGQRVALVGASGAGKSTIIHLLLRLYEPQLGQILIDGVDVRDYQRESLRQQIGLVQQDSILFGASIRENISYGKPDASQNEIEEAARQAHIHEFVASLPDGYETIVGESGSTLSGGQRQRIAIARALVKRPSILILDEPTSALDAESQAQVRETLERLERQRTVLVVTHQLSLVQDFDLILVLSEGEVVERGQHETLLAQAGVYAELYNLQQGGQRKMKANPVYAGVSGQNEMAILEAGHSLQTEQILDADNRRLAPM